MLKNTQIRNGRKGGGARVVAPRLRAIEADVQSLKQQIAALETRLVAQEYAYHVPQSLDELMPRVPTPPGKTPMQMIAGQWPGDESIEELLAQLKELG